MSTKFKVGDLIKVLHGNSTYLITAVSDGSYWVMFIGDSINFHLDYNNLSKPTTIEYLDARFELITDIFRGAL